MAMNFPKDFTPEKFLNDVVILINSCDQNYDVLSLLIKSIDENWKENPFKIKINTESNGLFNAKNSIKDVEWGERLIKNLNSLQATYVIFLLDDYILEEKINIELIYKALEVLHADESGAAFYLNYCTSHEEKNGDYFKLKAVDDARLNSHPAIWRRKDLLQLTESFDTPWSWETFGNYRTFNSIKNFYSVASKEKDIYKYDYRLGGAIYRGKWVKEVVEPLTNRFGLSIDLSKRGFVKLEEDYKRPFKWKLAFVYLGFKTIGFRMFGYIFSYLKKKIKNS